MVYARSGSGTYHLKMNSYKCSGGNTPIIVASADADKLETSSEITAPTAEFVSAGATQ